MSEEKFTKRFANCISWRNDCLVEEKLSKSFANCISWRDDCFLGDKSTKHFVNCISWSNYCLVEGKPIHLWKIASRGVMIFWSKRYRPKFFVEQLLHGRKEIHQDICKLHFVEQSLYGPSKSTKPLEIAIHRAINSCSKINKPFVNCI